MKKHFLPILFVFALVFVFVPQAKAEVITWTASTNDFDNLGGTTGAQMVAQDFTPSVDGSVVAPTVGVSFGAGAATDDLVVSVEEDVLGTPSGIVLGSATLPNASVPSAPCNTSPTTFPSITGLTIHAGTKYWLIVSRSGSLSNTDRYYFCFQDSAPSLLFFNGAAWLNTENGTLWQQVEITGSLPQPAAANYCLTAFGTTTGCEYRIVDYPNLDHFMVIMTCMVVFGFIVRYFAIKTAV